MKLLQAMSIYSGLENPSSIHVSNILVESNCLEIINLLNDVGVDFSKVCFFFIEEADSQGLSKVLTLR